MSLHTPGCVTDFTEALRPTKFAKRSSYARPCDLRSVTAKNNVVDYDSVAIGLEASKRLPFRLYLEFNSIQKLLGDVCGQSILDLSCGAGIYARRLRKMGASTVLGVDRSSKMISLALEEEARCASGVNYRVGDATKLGKLGEFDVVLAPYLLNCAKTPEMLLKMLKSAKVNLHPDGKMVGVNNNPFNDLECSSNYRRYGFTKSIEGTGPIKESDVIKYRFFNYDGRSAPFRNFHLSAETYENAFSEAGFDHFEWVHVQLSDAGRAIYPSGYWDELLMNSPIISFIAY